MLCAGAVLVGVLAGPAAAVWTTGGSTTVAVSSRSLPAAPTGLTVTAAGCTATASTVTIAWDAVVGATSYTVARSLGGAAPSTLTTTSGTSATDTLTLGSVASYTVTSTTGTWNGGPAGPVSAPLHC